jgi:hypothetical protein
MRVLIFIGLVVSTTFLVALFLAGLVKDALEESNHSAPDLDNNDAWNGAAEEFAEVGRAEGSQTERWAVSRHSSAATQGGHSPEAADALDDLHSAL